MITRDGKFSSRVSPVQGGGTRASVSSARSESAGGAVRSPEGVPPRRPGKTGEHGDVGGAATHAPQLSAAAAISGDPIASPDEGANFTLHICVTFIQISSKNLFSAGICMQKVAHLNALFTITQQFFTFFYSLIAQICYTAETDEQYSRHP